MGKAILEKTDKGKYRNKHDNMERKWAISKTGLSLKPPCGLRVNSVKLWVE